MGALVACVGMASAIPASATTPNDVAINADLTFTGPTSAAGTYAASGAISDQGTAAEDFRFVGSQVQGTKVMTSANGTISLYFDGKVTSTGPTTAVVDGRWVITGGTGNYAGEHGDGSVHSTVDFATSTLHSTLTGKAFSAGSGE